MTTKLKEPKTTMLIRIDPDLKAWLETEAANDGRSTNNLIVKILGGRMNTLNKRRKLA